MKLDRLLRLFSIACATLSTACLGTSEQTIAPEDEAAAVDVAAWAMPVVSFFAQKEANERDMGAEPNQILFWSRPLDHNNKILTPNDVVLYISAQIETFDGPMVLEVPPSEGPLAIFGSLVDPFMVPLEDVGGSLGIDGGLGGRILLVPPGYTEPIPDDYLVVRSAHFNTVAGLRITPESFEPEDVAAAIAYVRQLRLYPLGGDPSSTVFVDGGNRPYDPRPPYDQNFFRLLDVYAQTEAHKPIDVDFIGRLESVGIVKGEPFSPDSSHARVAARLEEQLQAGFRDVGDDFFPGAHWTTPIEPMEAETQFTYVDDEGNYDWRARAQTFHWAIWAPKHLGGDTFYLIGQRDSEGQVLRSTATYRFRVPPEVPAQRFWSITVYEFETGGTFFDDVSRVALSSKVPELAYDEDGAATLTIGSSVPEGYPASNHIPTRGEGHWFALFRWYGPMPALMPAAGDARWTMGDFEVLTN